MHDVVVGVPIGDADVILALEHNQNCGRIVAENQILNARHDQYEKEIQELKKEIHLLKSKKKFIFFFKNSSL